MHRARYTLFLEPLVYDNAIGDEKGLEFAKKKPLYVARTMEEFSQPRYGVDVLKVELPINPLFVAQTRAFAGGQAAYTRQEALMHLRKTADATKLPFIYLSAGINNEVFCEMLELAAEAGAKFAGVLCGRATWQQGIQVYAREGVKALEYWLAEHGAQNIQALNRVLTTMKHHQESKDKEKNSMALLLSIRKRSSVTIRRIVILMLAGDRASIGSCSSVILASIYCT